MRSASKAAVMIALCAVGTSLAGCNRLDVNSQQIRGIAYVRVADVMKHHPLYSQLSRIDDAIAMVGLAGTGPRVPRSAAAIAREDSRLRSEMQAAQQRTERIVAQKQQDYAARERAAVSAALAAAGVKSAANVAAALGRVSSQQAQQAQVQAGRDFAAYQRSVVQQGNSTAAHIVQQLQREANEKLQAKAAQEQQAESDLSLRLSQQDATRRLAIQTRLSMLALDTATRRQLQGELTAINRRESEAMAAQRAADQRAFLSYRAQVMAQTNAAMREQLSLVRDQTRSEIVGRSNAVRAQLGALPPAANVPLSPATRAQIRHIAQQFQQQYQDDVRGVITEFTQTRDALEAQYATLHGADAAAASATAQEVAILQQRRQLLYNQMQAQIQREAERLAKKQGLKVVFVDVTAAPGGYDMTNELIADIENLHE